MVWWFFAGGKQPSCQVNNSCLSNAEAQNACSYAPSPPIYLHGKLNFTSPPPFFLNWESKWNSRIFHSLYIQRNITVIYRIELNMNWIHGENTACLRVVDTGDGRYIRGKSYWTQTDMNIISSGPLGWGLDTQLCVNAKTNSDINTVTLHYNWTSCRWSEIPKMVWCHPHVTVITGLPSPRTAR